MPEPSIGDRRSFAGELCTIRYIGPIPAWDVLALGVEWDSPSRGRHSGTLDGKRYFECVQDGAGSFVKITRCPDPSLSFSEALMSKYASTTAPVLDYVRVSRSKVMQEVGFDKHESRQSRFDQLQVVSLAGHAIDRPGDYVALPQLQTLDLSQNLFISVATVYDICRHYSMSVLILNRNRFSDGVCPGQLPSVLELSLTATFVNGDILTGFVHMVPNLRRLSVAHNQIANICGLLKDLDLDELDLSYNQLAVIPSTRARFVNLSHNCISKLTNYQHQTGLDVSHNQVQTWADAFPQGLERGHGLKQVRINGNPFYEGSGGSDDNDDTRLFAIGALGSVDRLNGESITPAARADAETFFVNKVSQHQLEFDVQSPRWQELSAGALTTTLSPKANTLRDRLIVVTVQHQDQETEIATLPSMPLARFKRLACRRLDLKGDYEFEQVPRFGVLETGKMRLIERH